MTRGQQIYDLTQSPFRDNRPPIVAILVEDKERRKGAFITWGNLLDRWGYDNLLTMVKHQALSFGFYNLARVSVGHCLQEISTYPYFYEAYFNVLHEGMPIGQKSHRYACWAGQKRARMRAGKELFFAGFERCDNTQEQKDSN